MNQGNTFTASSTRRRIFEELEKIINDHSYTTIVTHHGKPVAVLTSYHQYQSWQKTLQVAADPLLVKDLEDVQKDLQAGDIITYQELFGKPQPGLDPVEKGEIVYRTRHATHQEKPAKQNELNQP